MGRETTVQVTQTGGTRVATGLHPAEGMEESG